eukprot:scaffold427_cov103-Alexandrium_tamarense.AAC.19
MVDKVSIMFNNGMTTACAPFDGSSAGDFSVTFQSLSTIAGDVPLMIAETSSLDGARRVDIASVVDGDAPLSGSLKISFRGAVSEAIDVSLDKSILAKAIEDALEALDTIQQDGVVVSEVDLDNGGYEKIFCIEFQGDGVGGNVEPIAIVPEHLLVLGSSADAFVLSDGESYAARNGLDSVSSQVGNELSGRFRLRLRGHTTGLIPFNSSVDEVKARLEELPNIGTVDVQVSGPSKEMAYSWTVTFLSNPGYFPPSARDVDLLEAVNELSTSVESDASASILVETIRDGDDRLKGQFQISYNDGNAIETTQPLESFISADDLKLELEALPNIGRVNVVRSQSLVGYKWDIEFSSCALKGGSEVCNDGDLLPLIASNVNLQGCGSPQLGVSEVIVGNGPDECPHLSSGLCYDESSFDGEYPIVHTLGELTLGTPYYVQVRLRNSQSYGYRRLSAPLFATPEHNPPGSPPPVVLKDSTSTSITVGWSEPRDNGGKAVSGYELWMDTWSGGDTFMVYDGAGSPNVMEYRLSTSDVGPRSQILETGRQYRFQVRAINNCDTEDQARACYGVFSEVQIFTVRDPRPPLSPSMPRRDSSTRVSSADDATIAISWSPPVDNGGSPITGYVLYMRDSDGTMTNYALGPDATSWQDNGIQPGEVYRFHVVAMNALGKSGNSPVLSILAAMSPGLSYVGLAEYSSLAFRPVVIGVDETSITTKWSHLPVGISGGTPVTGFKLYMYKEVSPLSLYDADPINQEVQNIAISSQYSASGSFTASFKGYETSDIPVNASSEMVQTALENLPSINVVNVESTLNGWSVTFLSEAGDLPLMEVTSGRLLSEDANAKVLVTEVVKGDSATLVYDGSEAPATLTFEALDLTPDVGYAFRVAPINSVGEGVLSASSIVTVARSGASASKTTATGSALSRGIAGSIHEEQIVTFLSNDCMADELIVSFGFSDPTPNLCDATADEFRSVIELLAGVGKCRVSREAVSAAGYNGYSWTVVFTSRTGDVPMLSVDRSRVGNGRDASGESASNGVYVVEFLKGQANEFTIEPKKASGSVVRDVTAYYGMEGGDVFFSELWTSDASVLDGSHVWYSDGGVGTYNALIYEEQVLAIPNNVGSFFLSMDTSETQPMGRFDGVYARTIDFQPLDVTDLALQDALSALSNVGKVDVTRTNAEHESIAYFVVTFKAVYGEMPLIGSSDPLIVVSRNGGQYSATEIQTITVYADKPFRYEVQSVAIPSSRSSFNLSYRSGPTTSDVACTFANTAEADAAVSSLENELNSLPGVTVRVHPEITGNGDDDNPWTFKVTFIEPVGPLPLLDSDNAVVTQLVQGDSTLDGSLVLSYEGEYTDDMSFDASAREVKSKLEMLSTIAEVDVKRIDKYTGFQWVVSFTGNTGNLPLVVAHDNVFEVQSVETVGGQPTPLGGTFSLRHLSEETSPLPFDSSADIIKTSLESLSSIDRVDVSQEMYDYGQSKWLITFRSPSKPALLQVDSSSISGTLDDVNVDVVVDSKSPSLRAKFGSAPRIVIEEKVPGRPSYTGQYFANDVGTYALAVMQLESGGLNAKYYDNQWLLDDPIVERVDPTINFDWGSGIITPFGRDYISVRWWGKVQPMTSEPYTFYLNADDGARLYIDHELVIDLWQEHSIEKRATVSLVAGSFHDVKLEYFEITVNANIQLRWSSRSIKKQVIPNAQLFYPSHIVGSPFLTTVSPGAADYPYSDFIEMPGLNRSEAIAGDRTSFYIQAKDSAGNNKSSNGDAQGDVQSPEEQFTVDIIGAHTTISGDVTYMSSGQYRVDYSILKAGTYQVHVKTGGTDIYCGLGEDNKCSPFELTVLPGETLASNCEVESSFDPVDSLVEARSGVIGKVYLQAKDAFGNNRITGGDDVVANFKRTANPDIQYRGNVLDRGDGSYVISYSIPLAGNYIVSVGLGGEPVQYCLSPSGDRWDARQYDGISVYSAPPFCSLDDDLHLNVIHRELHGISSTVINEASSFGLSDAIVGVETGFIVESRDKFGNLRSGSSTTNIDESGDGMSDAFLVTLVGPSGKQTTTSSAVQTLTCADSSVAGYFRLSFGGRTSYDIPHDVSGPAMQVVLSSMHGGEKSVQVNSLDVNGNKKWKITFVDHLELWSKNPLAVLPGSDGFSSVSDLMTVNKEALDGVYPIHYTLWEKGTHEMSVFSGTTLVSGGSYMVDVVNGTPQASSSSASGIGLEVGTAGETAVFEVQVRDQRQSEVQSIMASGTVIQFIDEVQRIQVATSVGDTFQLQFRGQQTTPLEVGLSTLDDLVDALQELATIGKVDVSSDGTIVIQNGDSINVTFLTERGGLDSMESSGLEVVTRIVEGEAPYRAERHSFYCDADGGYVILSFDDRTTTIEYDDNIDSMTAKISSLVGHSVSIVDPDVSISTVCNGLGKQLFIDYSVIFGDVEPISVNFDALSNGSMTIYGHGEEDQGAVNGISPIMGHFTITHNGDATVPIHVDASADDIKVAMENLPSIGSVSVTKDVVGIRHDFDNHNSVPGSTSLFNIWTVTFAHDDEEGCHAGSWDKCPSNIGDVSSLMVDSSLLHYEVGSTQQQPAPLVAVFEVKKGSPGNLIDAADDVDIQFTLAHDTLAEVGIGTSELHILRCSYTPEALEANDASGSFEIHVFNKRIVIDAQSSMAQLKNRLRDDLGLVNPIVTAGSSYGTVCRFDADNPKTAVTRLAFSEEDGSFPEFIIQSEQNVVVSANNLVDAVDSVEYLGGGRFSITYTPTVSGHYSTSIQINNDYAWVDLSAGLVVQPTTASALQCTHDSNFVAIAGNEESFHVVARDRFGNKLSSFDSDDITLLVSLMGVSNSCNDIESQESPLVSIEKFELGSEEGHYRVAYTPALAGQYQSTVMLRSRGGLLATYYKNQDFSQPAHGEVYHSSPSQHETPWCVGGRRDCDSTLLDPQISFSWGYESPLSSDPSFPVDSFSVVWEGELKVDVSNEYTFFVKLNGGVRLTIGDDVMLDYLPECNTEIVSSAPIELDHDVYYPIKFEYAHSTDDARVELLWEASSLERQVVPSNVLYYTRHIEGSPFLVQALPGDIDASSSASGKGLDSCVALEQCSFTIQAKDANQNNLFNNGTDPNFDISIVGIDDWAGEGRVNSVVSSSLITISDISVESNAWEYIGDVDVTVSSSTIITNVNFLGRLKRGDSVVIEGVMYIISSTGTFDAMHVPLESPYLEPTKEGVSLYKASKNCLSGTHTINYTPSVRGSYEIDVQLPMISEVQRVTTLASDDSSLSGSFTLTFGTSATGKIEFDATTEEFKAALEVIEGIGFVDVTRHSCSDASVSCSWDVTFLLAQDVDLPMANKAKLFGDEVEVRVEEMVKGRKSQSTAGFPRTINVTPGETSPVWTTAFGNGLVSSTAGEKASFIIQAKDSYGNDRLAEQDEDLFAVYIYPEQPDDQGLYPTIETAVKSEGDGRYTVEYTPQTSGFHTIAVVQSVTVEQQQIITGYTSKARGGTFKLLLDGKPSSAIPWDADEETIRAILNSSFGDISTFSVEKHAHGLYNFKFIVTVDTALGDVPQLTAETSTLIGNVNEWNVVTLADGRFAHIKVAEPAREVQLVKLEVNDPMNVEDATFALTFMGRRTEPISWDATPDTLRRTLQKLSTVGDVVVSLDVDGGTNSRSWLVTFDPYQGASAKGVTNFGNAPQMEASQVHESVVVMVETVEDGDSPFRTFVSPSRPSFESITAYDYPGTTHFEGLSTGVYKSETNFYLQARDKFANTINDGPLSEVQIIETISSSQIGGRFEVSLLDKTVRFEGSAFISELEKGLRSVPGVGSVKVTSNSVKDLIVGKTVVVTKGLNVVIPNEGLNEFIVGDWIRIGDEDDGQLFSIAEISLIAPYSVTLSSSYLGESDTSASIYQHGTPLNRKGYQYIVSFDSSLGDLPAMQVDGDLMDGDDATIQVTSCDWNVRQSLQLYATAIAPIEGHFYLTYKGEQTRLMSVDVSDEEIAEAITTDISGIHSASVSRDQDYRVGAKSWTIQLLSFDHDAELFFAEGHLITGGSVVATPECPVASKDSSRFKAQSVAGRRGLDFVVSLDGATTVHGDVNHIKDGRYLTTYTSPRVGEYSMSVQAANVGGLTGEYFNNRWLHGEPTISRVDSEVDFEWGTQDSITPTGRDFVSVRWTGLIKPSFDEVYTFTAHVNDALRLWIGDELLIDEYDNEVSDEDDFVEYSVVTSSSLRANQLVEIKVEYRENRGTAMIRLFWESYSQPFAVIDRHRLFSNASHISGSPFEVKPQAIKPEEPIHCSLDIVDWNALQIDWSVPEDDGGDEVTKYLVESWDANEYGLTEKQQLRFKDSISGGSFTIGLHVYSVDVPIGSTAFEFEQIIESLPNVGDLLVTKSAETGVVVYDVEFLTNNAPVPVLTLGMTTASPESDQNEYCVCANGASSCESGSLNMSCDPEATRNGSVVTTSTEIAVAKVNSNDGIHFTHIISDVEQSSDTLGGFGVRVSASNSMGYGVPCSSVFLKPMGLPMPPDMVEINRVASNPSSLALHFTSVSYPEDKSSIVTGYFVEWSTTEDFLPGTVANETLGSELVMSERLPSYNGVNKVFNYFLIEGLDAGRPYFVRIAAINSVGVGHSSYSNPLSIAPGSKPTDSGENGVTIATIPADATVSVAESSSSLRVSWRAPFSCNGFDVSSYLIEYWVADGVAEVQEISLHSTRVVKGTFTLGYEHEETDSLSIDSSAEDVKDALESLSSIRNVRVWRRGMNPDYTWSVTFLSEYPSVKGSVLLIKDTTLADDNGGDPTLQVNLLTQGELPVGYNAEVVTVKDPLQTQYHHVLADLTPGQSYHVQVSAVNELGHGRPRASLPSYLAPPLQKPDTPTNVRMNVASSNSLEVTFSHPLSDGGDVITAYRLEWDPQPTFDSNDFGSHSFIANDECDPCVYTINGLAKGQTYHVRVFSFNSYGYSQNPGLPTPPFLSPKTAPDPPSQVHITPETDTAVLVSFRPPLDDGGAPVSKYKLQSITSMLYSSYTVQSIAISTTLDDIDGSFRLAFGNQATYDISVDATGNDVKSELEALPTIGSVDVVRHSTTEGVIWFVTFFTNREDEALRVSDSSLQGTDVMIVVKEEVTALKGYEQQTLTALCTTSDGVMSGYFSLFMDGARTVDLPFNVSAGGLKDALEELPSIGSLKILKKAEANGNQWTVIFLDRLGNVPLLEVHHHLTCSTGTPLLYATETAQGVLPSSYGPLAGEVEYSVDYEGNDSEVNHVVEGLTRGLSYHFQVAWGNEVGYGDFQYSFPATTVPMGVPDPPSSVTINSIDNSTLQVEWSILGSEHQIKEYMVKLSDDGVTFDDALSFAVKHTPEIQAIILESTAQDTGGTFSVIFMNEKSLDISVDSDAEIVKEALEGLSTIDAVDIELVPHSYGKRWIVTFTSQEDNLPSLLVSTSDSGNPSVIATGGSLIGSSAVVRVETISDGGLPTRFVTPSILSVNESYVARVSVSNGYFWSPSTSSHAITPTNKAPSPPRDVFVNALSDTEIGVSWSLPMYSGGVPISGFTIQYDTDLLFDMMSVTVDNRDDVDIYSHVIENLDPSDSYYVRVMAHNSKGFSEPEMATSLLANIQTVELSLVSINEVVDFSETFILKLTNNGIAQSSNPLSIIATAIEVEDELNSLGLVASVVREDHSSVYDSSGIETHSFDMRYSINIVYLNAGEAFTVSIESSSSLGSIIAAVAM